MFFHKFHAIISSRLAVGLPPSCRRKENTVRKVWIPGQARNDDGSIALKNISESCSPPQVVLSFRSYSSVLSFSSTGTGFTFKYFFISG
jgi:hypothetical protein